MSNDTPIRWRLPELLAQKRFTSHAQLRHALRKQGY